MPMSRPDGPLDPTTSTDPIALYRQGAGALEAGRTREAQALLTRAVALAPQMAEAQRDLGLVLDLRLRHADAVACLQKAVAARPDDALARNGLGNALQALGDLDGAMAAYRAAEALAPDEAGIRLNIGSLLEKSEDFAAATTAYEAAVGLEPGSAVAHCHLARSMLAEGRTEDALEAVDRSLAIHPYMQQALALKGILLRELGRRDDARALLDFDRFLRSFELAPPPAYGDFGAFHAALIDHVTNHPTMARDPYGSSTKGGLHSGNLLDDKAPPVAALKALLQGVFRQYLQDLPYQPGHPFAGRQHRNVVMNAQAQVLDPDGHLNPHIHESGWISGAYYVRVPKTRGKQGWIEFGRPPAYIRHHADQEIRLHQPREGTAVLFPSYFFHGTLPAHGRTKRISIGIDLIPIERKDE